MVRLTLITTAILLMTSCQKEILPDGISNEGASLIAKSGDRCLEGIDVECNMPYFQGWGNYHEIYDCLYEHTEIHIDAFESNYTNLNDDAYYEAMEIQGFEEHQILIDFEAMSNYESYRKYHTQIFDDMLANGADTEDYPEYYLIPDPIAATLRNKNGAVNVGGTIYVTVAWGENWTFCSCEAYEEWLQSPYEEPQDECAAKYIIQGINGNECQTGWVECEIDDYWANEHTRRAKMQTWFGYNGQQFEVAATIHHYRQKNGGFQRWGSHLKPTISGYLYDMQCERVDDFLKPVPCKRRRERVAYDWFPVEYTMVNQEITGHYRYSGCNIERTNVLDYINDPMAQCNFLP